MNPRSSPERSAPAEALGRQLQWLRLRRGWNMDHVATAAGVSRTTLFHLERGTIRRPRASTLHKLAQLFEVEDFGFGISDFGSDATVQNSLTDRDPLRIPNSELRTASAFDRATNPIVTQVARERPELFAGWSEDEWDELYSQFATGGALREEGVRLTAERINHDREILYRLRVVLQTHLADVAAGMVDALFKLASVEPEGTPPDAVRLATSPIGSGALDGRVASESEDPQDMCGISRGL